MDTATRQALASLISELQAREDRARALFESASSQDARLHRVGEWNAYNCARSLAQDAMAQITQQVIA
jgi:hypothetical protein